MIPFDQHIFQKPCCWTERPKCLTKRRDNQTRQCHFELKSNQVKTTTGFHLPPQKNMPKRSKKWCFCWIFFSKTALSPSCWVVDLLPLRSGCYLFGSVQAEDGVKSEVMWLNFPRDSYHFCSRLGIYPPKINISYLGKRKIIFKMPFLGDMLVPWRVYHHP